MEPMQGPVRSLLFVPGDNERMLEKSFRTAAGALIFDLEDAVDATRKQAARAATRQALTDRDANKPVFVRVNAFDTGMTLEDLCAVMPLGPDGIVLPKCDGPGDIEKLGHHLDALEAAFGLENGKTRILPVATETPRAVLSLVDHTNAHDRLWGLLWGAEDLSAELGAVGPRLDGSYSGPSLLARNLTLIAARNAGAVPVDAVYTDITDLEGLEREARIARHDGFAAKAVIHPSHVEVVNEVFRPTESELERARRIVDAMEQANGRGAVRVDGQLVEKPHYKAALALLAQS